MSNVGRILLLALASAAIVAGCGGGGEEIPREDGERLLNRLAEVEGAVPSGQCEGAMASATLLVEQVGQLPDDVDSDVREALEAGSARLVELAGRECEPAPEPEPEPVPVEPPPEPPEEPDEDEDDDEEEREREKEREKEEKEGEKEQEAPDRNDGNDGNGQSGGTGQGGGANLGGPPDGGIAPERAPDGRRDS